MEKVWFPQELGIRELMACLELGARMEEEMIDVSVLRFVVLNLSKINKVNSVRLWHNVSYQWSCWFRCNFQF